MPCHQAAQFVSSSDASIIGMVSPNHSLRLLFIPYYA